MVEANGCGQIGVVDAAFLGVGATVRAGIFALLGEAGVIAGSAVWGSFLIAGTIAMLQGSFFAKLGQETESTAYPDLAPTPGFYPRLFLSPARGHQPRVDDPSGHYDFGPM